MLDVHRDIAVVEVLEGTSGMRLDDARVSFTGAPMQIAVGPAWLGRVCNGRGEPIDGGPPITGTERREIAGQPINPATRAVPRDAILTGISAVDGLASLVRGQKLPIFSVGGLPHLELASQIAAQASAGDEPFAVVFAAMGVTHADASAVRDALEERSAARRSRAAAQYRRRSDGRAHRDPAHRPHDRRAPGVRPGTATCSS